MRILHVLDHSIPLQSGYTFRTLSILTEQRKRGWETVHLTSPKHTRPYQPEEDVDGWHFYRTKAVDRLSDAVPVINQVALMAATSRRLAQVVAATKPDLLHAHSPVLNAIPALRVGHARGIPVVYEVRAFWEDAAASHGNGRERGPRYLLTRALETFALKHADAVTVICEGLRARPARARHRARTRSPSFPTRSTRRNSSCRRATRRWRQASGSKAKSCSASWARSIPTKGCICCSRPCRRSSRPCRRRGCSWSAAGRRMRGCAPLAGRLGLDGKVVFTGRVKHTEVQRYYALVDVLVYPRMAIRLTDLVTPLKPLEAMALGKIVVASDVGGHRELIRDGETGNLFRAEDKEDLVRTLARVVANRAAWPAQIAAGHRFVELERTWASSVARYEPVYRRLVGARTISSNSAS